MNMTNHFKGRISDEIWTIWLKSDSIYWVYFQTIQFDWLFHWLKHQKGFIHTIFSFDYHLLLENEFYIFHQIIEDHSECEQYSAWFDSIIFFLFIEISTIVYGE